MPHPVHRILKRFLDSEQFAFDSTAREFWPSERFVPGSRGETDHAGRAPEPGEFDGVYLERECES